MAGRLWQMGALCVLVLCATPAIADLVMGSPSLVSKQRVGRTLFDYTYQIDLTNTGPSAAQAASATVNSTAPGATVTENTLTFGSIAAGATVTSSDTFTIRQNRATTFDPTALVFDVLATQLSVNNFNLIGKRRVGRTQFEYDYQVELTNSGFTNAQGITASVTSTAASTVVVEGNLTYADIPSGAAGTSTDTFTIRQDRTATFDPNILVVDIQATPVAATDLVAPQLTVAAPTNGGLVITNQPLIEVTYSDDRGTVNTASLAFTANGQPLGVDCQLSPATAQCMPTATLPEGLVSLAATVQDPAGNTASTQTQFTVDSIPVELVITGPADGLITKLDQIEVTGTAGAGVDSVDVNGVIASLSGSTFNATVPLRDGKNMLVAVATKDSGRTGTDSVDITRDIVAPIVSIDSPSDGFVSVNDSIAVTGKVNDIVNGGTEARVIVNGVEATVAGGAFMVMDIPLVRGSNTINAVATDAVGNEGSRIISVTFQSPVGARMREGSGNGQAAQVNQILSRPLVAIVQDDLGNPVAGRVVKFEVTRNSGDLKVTAGDTPVRMLQVPTDGSGKASVLFTLGDTAGEGNNRVKASAVGVAGEVEFCASGLGAPPQKILMVDGDNQRGVIGFPLANPLEALVVDKDGNPSQGVEVTFSIVRGTGNLDGAQSQVKVTGADGIARSVLTLGLEAGINNNVVKADFAGLTGLPATFVSSGLAPGNPADTKFSGVVLDNGHTPIPGALVTILNTSASDTTDEEGQFMLDNVPVGHIHLNIDPTNSTRAETYPPLGFETVTIAGQTNVLGQPILIPALQTESSRLVGGNEDVTLRMPGVAGLELTVFANSVTCPDGSSQCQVSISQVHLDKVPMPPPSGTIFMPPAWTIQSAGTLFDPPAKISIPNDGLPPGRVIDIFQFDHTLNEFINVGKGTVSNDGLVIVSDPGFGITRAGWGGGAQPPPPTTTSCGGGAAGGGAAGGDGGGGSGGNTGFSDAIGTTKEAIGFLADLVDDANTKQTLRGIANSLGQAAQAANCIKSLTAALNVSCANAGQSTGEGLTAVSGALSSCGARCVDSGCLVPAQILDTSVKSKCDTDEKKKGFNQVTKCLQKSL